MRILMLLLCGLLGCSTFQTATPDAREADTLPATIQSCLEPPDQFTFVKVSETESRQRWEVRSPDFTLKYDYFPNNRRTPQDLVIIFNILKDKHQTVSGWLVSNLSAVGYNCIIIQQEDFLSRKKFRPILPDPEYELLDWNTYFAENLRHLALVVHHWIPQQSELSGRYSFVGVSMGGILSVASAACFPEAQISVTVMAGGDNFEVLSTSKENLVSRAYQNLISYYKKKDALSEEETLENIQRDLMSLDFSILGVARCVDTHKIRQIISLYDTSVPTPTQWNLHQALGGPEARLYPTGHISLGIFAWSVRDQIIAWLNEANP